MINFKFFCKRQIRNQRTTSYFLTSFGRLSENCKPSQILWVREKWSRIFQSNSPVHTNFFSGHREHLPPVLVKIWRMPVSQSGLRHHTLVEIQTLLCHIFLPEMFTQKMTVKNRHVSNHLATVGTRNLQRRNKVLTRNWRIFNITPVALRRLRCFFLITGVQSDSVKSAWIRKIDLTLNIQE